MVFMYFSKFYPLNLFIIKLIFWENYLFLGHGFYIKCKQNKIIFLMSYNSSSFDNMRFLVYGVSRHYITSAKLTLSPLQKFWNRFLILSQWYMEQKWPVPILMLYPYFEQLLILIDLPEIIKTSTGFRWFQG